MDKNEAILNSTDDKRGLWFLNIIGLLFFAGLAWWSYTRITRFETEGGFLALPKLLKMIYELVGKWGVVGIWLLGVLYNLIKGTVSFVKDKKA